MRLIYFVIDFFIKDDEVAYTIIGALHMSLKKY